MDIVGHLVIVFISIALVNNLVLTKFLGICPYLGVSRRIDMAFGMGCAVTFVITISGTVTWLINNLVLQKIGMDYLKYIAFIMVIASMVQLVEMYVRKFFPPLYESFGIFLPLITTNCAILGTCLFIDLWGYGFLEALVGSFGGGLGFTLVICMMGGIRENLEWADVPKALRGAGITLITAAIMTLAFMGFSGMIK
ncbi:MAG: RnfABCDGE type electron transport complex subunit A [Sedimentisphaerales bacterium]|nr:RnfABCDGE type electron transport complex subunit A [Sedimentisphaerales bacterium]